MSDANWGNYAEAYKAIHDKLVEILQKLDNGTDPQLTDIYTDSRIDLKSGSISNLGQIVNGDFESGYNQVIEGWFNFVGSGKISVSDRWSGFFCLTLKYYSFLPAIGGIFQPISPAIPTRYIKSFTLMAKNQVIDFLDHDLQIVLYYSDGTSTTQDAVITAWAGWQKVDLTYSPNKFIIGIRLKVKSDVPNWDEFFVDALSLNYESPIQIRGTADPVTAVINATGDNTIDTPASGKRLYVKKIQISNRSSNLEPRISFKFGAAGNEHFPITLAGYGTEFIDLVGMNWRGGTDEPLIAVRDSVNATVDCTIMKEEAEL